MSFHIALVEDETDLQEVLKAYLEREEWKVSSFSSSESAIQSSIVPDLWILDIMLPGMNGMELLKEIRTHQQSVPVIFISARDTDMDRIAGLEIGSDDYLTKPFSPKELVLRLILPPLKGSGLPLC